MSTTLKPRSATPRAPMPSPPARTFSFTDFQVANPTAPPPGNQLDSNFDGTNASISQTITWASTSLNTDGTIRAGVIGQSQLVSGLFDDLSEGVIDDVQPLVDEAQASATQAFTSANDAQASATVAQSSAVSAQSAATYAGSSASAASSSALTAQAAATTAGNHAGDADDAANHAAGDAALSSDLAVVSQAWAEHMPDTIPPNILAVMAVTGEHWSSRWWAHKAAGAFGSLSELYLGVWPVPPTSTSTGDPIPLGAIYYNSVTHQVYVWDGTQWQQFWAPTKAYTLNLTWQLTAGQTQIVLTTPDLAGNTWTLNAAEPEPLDLYLNGVRLMPAGVTGGDWTVNVATSTVTLVYPALAGTIAVIDILAPASELAPARTVTRQLLDFDVNPTTSAPGQIDGARTTFPLALAADHSPVSVLSPVELQVVLDGGIQKPGADYSVLGSNITFAEAPIPGEQAWAIWFAPGGP